MNKMSPEWERDAAAFGLDADEAQAHWSAWEDLQRLRPKAFVEQTQREIEAMLEKLRKRGEQPDPGTSRRLKARVEIIRSFADAAPIFVEFVGQFKHLEEERMRRF